MSVKALLAILDDHKVDQAWIDELRELLDLMENFESNDQRARFLLGSNFLRYNGRAIAARTRAVDQEMNRLYGREGIVAALTCEPRCDAESE